MICTNRRQTPILSSMQLTSTRYTHPASMQDHSEVLDSGSIWAAQAYSIDLVPLRDEGVRFIAHSKACQVEHVEGRQKAVGSFLYNC